MFKKIYKEFSELRVLIRDSFSKQWEEHVSTRKEIYDAANSIKLKMDMLHTIESQQRTIEQLTNALKDKYEHGLFIFSEDCKIPTVIRNGKELTNDLTTHFGIEWDRGETPLINIEQAAGTIADSER